MPRPHSSPQHATEVSTARQPAGELRHEEIEGQLQKILDSATFRNSRRHSRFLEFTVHKTLAGQSNEIKEYVIGLEVFDRPADFDPRSDPMVRAEARRLRSRLAEYYSGLGQADPILIDLPKGTYVPAFSRRSRIAAPQASGVPAPPEQPFTWQLRSTLIAAAITIVILVAVLILHYRARNKATVVADSIAVLPFVNLSDHPDRQYLGDGIAEELTTRLAQVKGLRVVAATSAFQFRDKGEDVRRIGQQLNAGALLEGSITRAPDSLRINAQLVSTTDGYHLWSKAYDVNADALFEAEDDIVRQSTAALRVPVEPGEIARVANRETKNAQAHELYLQGRFYFSKRDLPDMERAIELFRAAISKDPNFALAHAGLAETYAVMGGNDQKPLSEVVPKAQAALQRALELDPSMGETYATLALVNAEATGERRELIPRLRHAIEMSPNYATAHHWLGLMLSTQGRFQEADAELRQAQLLDPLSPMITEGVAENYYHWRRYDDSLAQLNRLQTIGFSAGEQLRGLAYIQSGKYQQAMQLFEAMHPTPLLYLALTHAAAGQSLEARQLVNEALAEHDFVSAYQVALVYVTLRERENAFEWFRRAIAQRDPMMGNLKVDPMLDSIRSDRRYMELVKAADLGN